MTEGQTAGTISSAWRRLLFGPSGLRAGWRLLVFFAIFFLLTRIRGAVIHRAGGLDGIALYVFNQATRFLFCLFAAGLMARFEGRSIAEYGLPWRQSFRLRFWQGMLIGFAALTALLGMMRLAGVFHLGPIATSGAAASGFAVVYGLICLIIGLSEEFFYRGYVQFTASTGIGFWPAAVLVSGYFGFSHLGRATETWLGALNAGLGGLVLCLFLRRTGNLWLSIGFHTSFNWAQVYFYGVPASGVKVPGHLFDSSFSGPAVLSGGTVGPEGSGLCTLMLAGLAIAFAAAFRGRCARDVALPRTPRGHRGIRRSRIDWF
jgi:membrane protease YdiL (CAAX protease family)